MGKLSTFTFISLDGYYKDENSDISWHRHGAEEAEFSARNAQSGNILLFGRKTYELMQSFWPTQMAIDSFPEVAKEMNAAEKIVFSKSMQQADWNNTRIIAGDMLAAVQNLKATESKNMTLLGSGSILTQLAEAGLIDEFQIMLDPVVLGRGSSIFEGISRSRQLQLTGNQVFKSGTIVLNYKPA